MSCLKNVTFLFFALFSIVGLASSSPSASFPLELYTSRPSIENIHEKEFSLGSLKGSEEKAQFWREFLETHFVFAAQLLELYPKDSQLYFLGRDGEYFFDAAKLITKGSEESQRIHLINISRANMRDPYLIRYLEQEGISEENLLSGQKIVLIDTGYSGTIIEKVRTYFSMEARENIFGHLLLSFNPEIPYSRISLWTSYKTETEHSSGNFQNLITNYEHIPHFTSSSQRFVSLDGKIVPVSYREDDEPKRKSDSLEMMASLAEAWKNSEIREKVGFIRYSTHKILSLLQRPMSPEHLHHLKALSTRLPERLLIIDAFQMGEKAGRPMTTTLQELGLAESPSLKSRSSEAVPGGNLEEIYPQWSDWIEAPYFKLNQLIENKDWPTFEKLMTEITDDRYNQFRYYIVQTLFLTPKSKEASHLRFKFVKMGLENDLINLVKYVFTKRRDGEYRELLSLVINQANSNIQSSLIDEIFSGKSGKFDEELLVQLVKRKKFIEMHLAPPKRSPCEAFLTKSKKKN